MLRQFRVIAVPVMLLCLALPLASVAQPETEQEQVAKKFLEAHMLKDLKTIRANTPTKIEHCFGDYPFKGLPTFSRPRVDDNQALVEFSGPVVSGVLPPKGGVLLKRDNGAWLVRQVLFYDKVPELLLQLPQKSVTAADRRQEPTVKEVTTAFLKDWQQNDISNMKSRWYNWTLGEHDPRKGLTMSNVKMSTSTLPGGDSYVKYSAKLSYRWGLLSYSLTFKGGVMLTKESGDWKVRPLTMVFDF